MLVIEQAQSLLTLEKAEASVFSSTEERDSRDPWAPPNNCWRKIFSDCLLIPARWTLYLASKSSDLRSTLFQLAGEPEASLGNSDVEGVSRQLAGLDIADSLGDTGRSGLDGRSVVRLDEDTSESTVGVREVDGLDGRARNDQAGDGRGRLTPLERGGRVEVRREDGELRRHGRRAEADEHGLRGVVVRFR